MFSESNLESCGVGSRVFHEMQVSDSAWVVGERGAWESVFFLPVFVNGVVAPPHAGL